MKPPDHWWIYRCENGQHWMHVRPDWLTVPEYIRGKSQDLIRHLGPKDYHMYCRLAKEKYDEFWIMLDPAIRFDGKKVLMVVPNTVFKRLR